MSASSSAPSLLWPDIVKLSPDQHLTKHFSHSLPTLVDLMYSQTAQVYFIKEFIEELKSKQYEDDEMILVCDTLTRLTESSVPLPLELTWIVLMIFYVASGPVITRLMHSTPPSLIKAWMGSPEEFKKMMENSLCGQFVAMGPGRARRGRVVAKCLTPLEIVTTAWANLVFEVTKPADIVTRENTAWN